MILVSLFCFSVASAINHVDEITENEEPGGVDEPIWPASMASGTLPIMYINTEEGAPIVDKETKIPAGLWIEVPEGCEDKQFALGSEDEPVTLEIKGRGNYTWTLAKKPYKLKFTKKTEIMGMPKHKHFALLAHYGNYNAWGGFAIGFELSRLLELGWTPQWQPVELVLNDSYEGLYFLVESVKIDKNRLDIYEQPEENTDPETIPYGWLVEIDNTLDEFQIQVPYLETRNLKVTHHSPEILSDQQREWLTNEFTSIIETITNPETAEDWVNYFDAQSFARYFIVREIMNDYDGFCGSVYMHRDMGADKWSFGPMWDTSVSRLNDGQDWDWTKNICPSRWNIVPEIFNTRNLNKAFLEVWEDFYPDKLTSLPAFVEKWYYKLLPAYNTTRERWGNEYSEMTLPYVQGLLNRVLQKAKWMDEHKNFYEEVGIEIPSIDTTTEVVSSRFYNMTGTEVSNPLPGGIYLQVDRLADGSTRTEKIIF